VRVSVVLVGDVKADGFQLDAGAAVTLSVQRHRLADSPPSAPTLLLLLMLLAG